MASSLTFSSLIHFEFIFIYSVRQCSIFSLLHRAVQFSQRQFLKRLSFLHCVFLCPLSLVNWRDGVDLFLGCPSCSTDLSA